MKNFRYDFFPIWRLQSTICTASVFLVWFALSLIVDRPMTKPHLLLSLAISAFCAVILGIVTAAVRFQVQAEGIRTFNTFGRWQIVPWEGVSKVWPAKYYFLPHLRLTVDGHKVPFWIPLFLNDMQAFRAAVIGHAGDAHPISRALPVPPAATERRGSVRNSGAGRKSKSKARP
ncbi:hypothetical protein WG899_18580 [Paucibacter sp. AS339]|uniref:hypothetical protein n=1 Tax=Paucibacter hankyongi TaxID=3133434 RepID=UPI0030B131C7